MKDPKKYSSIANSNILAEDEMEKVLGGECATSCKTSCQVSCKSGNKIPGSPTLPPTPAT